MPTVTINVGISVRPDGGGGGHGWDRSALNAARRLFDKPVRMGMEEITVEVNPQPIPKGYSGGYDDKKRKTIPTEQEPKRPERVKDLHKDRTSMIESNFDDVFTNSDFNGIDLLYIPGAASATPNQLGNAVGMVPAEGFKKTEGDSRDAFETALIRKAMQRGIPILAVCAGSWRLIESFGGQTRELKSSEIGHHHRLLRHTEKETTEASAPIPTGVDSETRKPNVWDLRSDLDVPSSSRGIVRGATDSTLKKYMGPQHRGADVRFTGLNSTHWAVANTKDGKLTKAPGSDLDPSKLLEIAASDPTTGTVEAFESTHGVPVVGAQWHPEGYLDGMPEDISPTANRPTVDMSQEVFRNLILAAVTAKTRRVDVVKAIKTIFTGAAHQPSHYLRKVPDEGKDYREDKYIPKAI